jgi:hypothetical protein
MRVGWTNVALSLRSSPESRNRHPRTARVTVRARAGCRSPSDEYALSVPESESPDIAGADRAADALRLHNGPLQCMFAGIMMLESPSEDSTDSAITVLRQGVVELNEIIESMSNSTEEDPGH